MMQDFNRSSSHPDIAANRFVSAGDQSSNPSSGGWERASSSSPCKGLSWMTSWGAQSGDRGGGGGGSVLVVFFVFYDVAAPFFGRERPGRRGKIRSDLKKYNASWSIGHPWVSDR